MHGLPQPAAGQPRRRPGRGAQALDGREDVRHGRVRDEVRLGLDVQDDFAGLPLGEQVVDQDEVGQQLPAGVVRDQADPGAVRSREGRPEERAVVRDQARCPGLLRRGGDPEAEVRPVAPERGRQQCVRPLRRGQGGQVAEGGEFLVDGGAGQLGVLEGRERVDALPGAGPEVAGGVEEAAVEVALRPQERGFAPGQAPQTPAPLQPLLVIVGVVAERLQDAGGALGEQPPDRGPLGGAVRQGVEHLPDEPGVPLVEDAPGEGPGDVGADGGGGGRVPGHAPAPACRWPW